MEQVLLSCPASKETSNQDSVAAVAFYRVTHSSRPAGTRQWIVTTSHWEALLSVMKCVLTTCTITLKLILRFARAQSALRVCKRTSDSYMSKYKFLVLLIRITTITLLCIRLLSSDQFRPQDGPSLGHTGTRNWILVETKHHEAAAAAAAYLPFHMQVH